MSLNYKIRLHGPCLKNEYTENTREGVTDNRLKKKSQKKEEYRRK
jgi:hypothetical protein